MKPELKRVPREELDSIADEMARKFSCKRVAHVVRSFRLIKLEGRWTEYFVMNRVDFDPADLPERADPFLVGRPFCERSARGDLRIHVEGARELTRHVDEIKTYVTERAAVLFTYGRDVLPESIVEIRGPKEPRLVAVVYRDDLGEHCVGVGRLRFSEDGRPVVDNVIDRGWYLRRGG
ncbi:MULTISPECIES: PUA domain-containing protein [unclassified Methanopyrus]|uniref:PUA domain-containing protein n=1 Tax=unclassified Methanopyrus TaxID=2684913 RepID=UPI0012F8B455|nr:MULTISPECIES: PUA domain-containing protein [unclassified Methanopyrus]